MTTLKRYGVLAAIMGVVLVLSLLSTVSVASVAAPLTTSVEMEVVGGSCAGAAGLAVGLMIAAVAGCEILCAVGAWYVIGGMAVACN
jgi:hypothetical protein